MNQFDVSILKSPLKRSSAAKLKRGRGLSFLQYCDQSTGKDDCWSMIDQIQNITSSTALLKPKDICKTWGLKLKKFVVKKRTRRDCRNC